jgi:hypothetical protein
MISTPYVPRLKEVGSAELVENTITGCTTTVPRPALKLQLVERSTIDLLIMAVDE